MEVLIANLRVCDRAIEWWQDSRQYVAGEREVKLIYWHAER
ncbi:hypothetical protein LCGC14_3134880, partial [marine sediment metagenome]